jgi:WD40 repeat protein
LQGYAAGGVAFAPDGSTLAASLPSDDVVLVDVSRRTLPVKVGTLEGGVTAVEFSPDGRHLAGAGGDSNTVRVWDRRRPEAKPIVLRGHEDEVYALAFSPDGSRLASAGDDRTVRVWDWRRPRARPIVLRGHEHIVTGISFSADGSRLASASFDKTVRVWDWRRPDVLPAVIRGHLGAAVNVAFGPRGLTLASVGADKTVKLDACRLCGAIEELADRARHRLHALFTPAERREVLAQYGV